MAIQKAIAGSAVCSDFSTGSCARAGSGAGGSRASTVSALSEMTFTAGRDAI